MNLCLSPRRVPSSSFQSEATGGLVLAPSVKSTVFLFNVLSYGHGTCLLHLVLGLILILFFFRRWCMNPWPIPQRLLWRGDPETLLRRIITHNVVIITTSLVHLLRCRSLAHIKSPRLINLNIYNDDEEENVGCQRGGIVFNLCQTWLGQH